MQAKADDDDVSLPPAAAPSALEPPSVSNTLVAQLKDLSLGPPAAAMEDRVVVKESPLHGKGLFAAKDIEAGSCIVPYLGPIVSADEADRWDEDKKVFLFAHYEEDKVIDGSVEENLARWINHRCSENNCDMFCEMGQDYPWVIARKNIKAGEELTYSYGRDFWLATERFCNCRSRCCYASKKAKEAAMEEERRRFWE